MRDPIELVKQAKAHPGKLNYGSGGVGGSDHVCTEYFLRTAGINVINVTYKGSAPALVEFRRRRTGLRHPAACIGNAAA